MGTDYDICELVGLQSTISIWSCLPAMGIEPKDLLVVLQVSGLVYQLWVLNQRTSGSTTSVWSCLPAMGIEPGDLVVVLQVSGIVYQLWVLNQRT